MTDLYETDIFKMDELAGEYSGVDNRFVIYNKETESGIYDKHGFLVKLNYTDCKNMIDNLTNSNKTNTMNTQNNPTESDNSEAKTAFEGDLDNLYGTIEELLRDECLAAYPELNCALQDVNNLIEKLDIKIDYYNC